MLLGETWLGQNSNPGTKSPLVDDLRRSTGDHFTIFQRINETGDMLRVCTSLVKPDGQRGIGTFIPRRNPDGSENPVVATVLRGEPFRGRAVVLGEWFDTAYEPLWDASHQRVVGMLFAGVALTDLNRDLFHGFAQTQVGKSGYVFILGTQGDQRGKYILSKNNARDGVCVWDEKDATGRFVIRELIQAALTCTNGATTRFSYSWQNPGENAPSARFAALTYFQPYDWVIGVSAYESDFQSAGQLVAGTLQHTLTWVLATAGVLVVAALLISLVVARSITRPIIHTTDNLLENTGRAAAAVGQISSAMQSVASSANAQATSLEETTTALEQMSAMARLNADNAQKASELVRQARHTADAGGVVMKAMSGAMAEIKPASDNIA